MTQDTEEKYVEVPQELLDAIAVVNGKTPDHKAVRVSAAEVFPVSTAFAAEDAARKKAGEAAVVAAAAATEAATAKTKPQQPGFAAVFNAAASGGPSSITYTDTGVVVSQQHYINGKLVSGTPRVINYPAQKPAPPKKNGFKKLMSFKS